MAAEAKKYDVLPLNDLGILEYRALEYEIGVPPSGQYTYYPGTAEVPQASAANTINVSYKILAEVEFTRDSQGVIFAQGSRFGGYSMFVKDGKLTYVYNFLGIPPEQTLSAEAPSAGRHIVGVEFTKERMGDHHEPIGPLKLYVDDEVVGEMEIRTDGVALRLCGEGLCIGYDGGDAVSAEYRAEVRVHRRHDREGRLRRRRRRLRRRRTPISRRRSPVTDLASWNDTATRAGDRGVRRERATGRRVAVFDNDGTLWCEKPMPIQLDFILRRWPAMAEDDSSLRERQPYKASHERDYELARRRDGQALPRRRQRPEAADGRRPRGVRGMRVDEYAAAVEAFFARRDHRRSAAPTATCGYPPMVELLRYLEANGFSTYIASGGDRDFMRLFSSQRSTASRRARHRPLASALALRRRRRRGLVYQERHDVFDDGPEKPVRIWSRIGCRPAARLRQLQRRHPDAAVRRRPPRPRCGC